MFVISMFGIISTSKGTRAAAAQHYAYYELSDNNNYMHDGKK